MCLGDYHGTELSHRMAAAWGSFAKIKHVLCSRRYPLPARLRLFDAVVTPTALYASSCWTVWSSTTSTLQSTWRRMLRKIVQVPRRHDESWVPYIRRSTRLAISKAMRLGHESWVEIQARRKRSLSERTQSDTQGKWSRRLLLWKPEFRTRAWRRTGRPIKRWADA